MLLTMMATTGTMWGQSRTETTTTCTFSTKAWAADNGGTWTSGKDGNQFTSGRGVQVTTGASGANGTSGNSFENVSKIVVTYSTNASKGKGDIKIKVGSGTEQSYTISSAVGTTDKTHQFDFSPTETGKVKITVNCTENSIYIKSVAITTVSGGGSDPSITASDVNIAYNAIQGSIAYTLNNATGNVNASITTGGDWLTSLGTITSTEVPFTCLANEGAAARTATVTLSYTGASNKVVTITQAGNPNAPGTQNNPYTVAQARAAIDAGTGTQGVYATGIVSEIVTAYGTGGYNNVTFNMVDEAGDEVFLQAFRCVGDDAPNVLVGDIAVVTGNLTKYGQTYEFASGCSVVSLEHPSTPYFTANDVNITYDATAGSIAYTVENSVQGGQVTAATTSTWLTLGTDFTSPITFTCDANEAGERTATVTLTYTYGTKTTVNKEVTVTQAGNPNVFDNIEDITEVGTAYSVKGTVVAINSRGFVMGDGTGYVYYYKNGTPEQAVNDKITLSGTTGTYGHIIQFTGTPTIAASETSNYDGNPAATVITAVPDYSTGYHLSTYLEFEGALEKSGSNYLITVGEGENNQIQISYPTTAQGTALTALDGKTVHIKGYFSGINSSSKFTVMLESAVEVAVPSITLAQYEYNLNADGGNAELPVTYTNMPANPQAEVIFYEANGETALTENPTWITAEINDNYNIAGHIDVNEGDARSAYFKVKGKDANNNDVYSNLVTINQAAAGATIEFNNTSMTLAAGGESDRQLSFDYSGLGDNPTFSINYYEQDGTTAATYNHDWLTATIEGDKVNISAVANTGEERKAYFKVYGEGNNTNAESNLVTITQAAYVVDYATLPFSWAGNTSAPTGITNNGVGTYSSSPYLKFDGTGDYIILKINERPGVLSFDIKGNGFSLGSTSTFKVQTSTDGTNYADLATYTELGETSNKVFDNLGAEVRYIKWIYTEKGATSGGNVALGNIALAVFDNTPSITAEDVNIAYDATEGSIAYTINNPVAGGNFQAIPQTGGDRFIIGEICENTIPFTCPVNTESNEQTATIELTYTYNRATVSKVVTITQAAAPATMYVVNFNLDDGTFVPNEDFPQDVVEKEAGTYTLPSATKAGFDFTGWNDGTDTYQAGAEYTVSGDVDFTAQWTESTTTTGTIAFGSASGSTPINSTSVTGDDSLDNEWTITTVFSGETSFTQNANYSQVGASSKPATSITFTMTLPQQKTISAFEAKFGGFSNTAGDINLYVGETNVGSGELDGTTDVIVEATTTTEVGTVLTVTVTNIAKGVKCYYISYTLSDAPVVPVIDATAGSALAYNATAGSIIYEIANYEAGTMTATTTADWINALVVTTPTAEDGEVTFNVTENTSNESRSATVTLTFTYGDPAATVTKDITVTQNGTPSITVTPATANVAFAGGAPDFAVTYESLDIDNASDFDVEFYETSTSTIAGNQPSWITNVAITGNTTDGFTLTVTVATNDGDARDAYLKVYAAGSNDYIYSNLVTINQAAFVQLTTYSLVTSVDQIVSGKHYLIASSATDGDAYAMGGQTSNNRSGVAVTIDNSQITETEDVYEFVINTHETSSKDVDYYTIYDAATPGYLYAASSSKNYLRTKTTLDDNGKWTIAIAAEGSAASIVAQGSNTRNNMKFNSSDGIFSCYASGQSPIYLYVKDNDNDLEYYGSEITYNQNTIPDGGSLTIGTGSVMTVPYNFENNNPAALVIEDGGQLIHTSDVEATLQKKVAAYTAKDGDGWYLIATPVEPLATSVVAQGTYDLFTYNEEHAYWYSNTGTGAPFTELHRGQGYLYANASDVDLNYSGTMKATNYNMTVDLSYTSSLSTDVRGFNLVGNPFTRNLVLGDMKIGTNPLTTFYVINTDRTGLQAITSDAYQIKPGEGFFVQATAASQQLSFNPSSKDEIDFRYIKIVAGNEAGYDNAYIQFGNCNTLRKMNIANKTEVYVMDGDDDYAAARVEELAGTMPIHFEAVADGEYTITIEAKYTDAHYMHLLDNLTGDDIDLLVEPSYTFNATTNDNADRFRLVFDCNNYTSVDENYTSEIFAYQNGSDIYVNGNGELQIFDVMGRMVATQHINGVQTINVKLQGVYIFRLNDNTQKIVVR